MEGNKPWYKKWWGITIITLILLFVGFTIGLRSGQSEAQKYYDVGYNDGYEKAKAVAAETSSSETKKASETNETSSTPSAVAILSHRSYIESGYYTVAGEVQNNTGAEVEGVKVVATFYDSNNQVLGTGFTFTEIEKLGLGQKSPFKLSNYPNSDMSSKITNYELQVDYR